MKIFDYKFILIIILTLLIYFLYRKIELLEKNVNQLNNINTNIKKEIIQLPLPNLEQFDNNDEQCIEQVEQYSTNEQYIQQNLENNNEIEQYSEDNNSEHHSDEEQYSEVYSNDQTDDLQIYSNDNDEDHHSSILEETVHEENNVDNSQEDTLSELLKNNKLPELQEIAEQKNISIYRENSSKKKTKLELANDIVAKN